MNKKGFTLIELIVVIIIVGILAAVAVPMMTGNLQQARRTEAVAALGTIRTAQRAYFAEHQFYATDLDQLNNYIGTTDLNGTYYNQVNYSTTDTVANATASGGPAVSMNIISGVIT